jgi:hypothetical protein
MKLPDMPLGAIDWAEIASETAAGISSTASGRVVRYGDIQMRVVDYGAGYVADHWCTKGHILFVISGDLAIEHKDGTRFDLIPGMVWHVGDNDVGDGSFSPHRVVCTGGARVFIVD